MSWPQYDQRRDGPDVFAWIISAAAAERARRRALCTVAIQRIHARYRAQLETVRALEHRELGEGK